jgi:uncharacterized membrane protein YqiK
MRHDPIEIGLAGKTARRRDAKRMIRTSMAARQLAAEAEAPATDALDEAFAGLSRDERRPKSLSVVTQLAEQLEALDRQRAQLAQLLRDIEVTALAD